MAKIAVLIDNLFEDSEYTKPAKAFVEAGHQLVHLGIKAGAMVRGKSEQTEVRIERSFAEAAPGEFDAIFIPGGYSPDRLRADEKAVTFTREFCNSNRPIFAICHAPQLLITADVLRRRKVTGWKSITKDIENAGAQYLDREVVVDGNLVTSRGPADIPAFIHTCLSKI